jgi:lipopolysaccharide/colanic/teichoic acid biosynthesis glycosyltransferase/tellurite resistance protein
MGFSPNPKHFRSCLDRGSLRAVADESEERRREERHSRNYIVPFRIAGSRGSSVSIPDRREDLDSIRPVANLMLEAAHVDGEFCESEQATVRSTLCQLVGKDKLPESLELLIAEFDPEQFDLQRAVEDLQRHSHSSAERVLQLVRRVCDADATIDIREDQYMVQLALALGLPPLQYRTLVVRESRGINGPIKRLEDLVLASLCLLLLAVPMLLIALTIKLTSRGPVFFRQRRYGRSGKQFDVLKFRSMQVLENGPAVKQAQKDDPRVTPIGRLLRRLSLDELPQLINVVVGDMSLIGPRPHAVAHNEMYRRQIVEYMLRHKVKPGITGWAQVNGWRGETDTLRKMVYRVEHDLYYIRNWSLWLDLKILWLTVFGRKVRLNAY